MVSRHHPIPCSFLLNAYSSLLHLHLWSKSFRVSSFCGDEDDRHDDDPFSPFSSDVLVLVDEGKRAFIEASTRPFSSI